MPYTLLFALKGGIMGINKTLSFVRGVNINKPQKSKKLRFCPHRKNWLQLIWLRYVRMQKAASGYWYSFAEFNVELIKGGKE
jgi:hypothetical protein